MGGFPHGVTVTILRDGPPTRDRYNNEVPGAPTSHDIEGCGAAPGDADELHDRSREGVEILWTIYAPFESDVTAHDRAVLYGRTYRVEGEPRRWQSPLTGWTPGTLFQLVDVTG